MAGSVWRAVTERPYEALASLALVAVGVIDLLSPGYPPDVADATPDWLLHVYGLWVIVGSLCAIGGLLTRCAWSLRVERFGVIMQATGLAVLVIALVPSVDDAPSLIPALVTSAVIAAASTARAFHITRRLALRDRVREAVAGG